MEGGMISLIPHWDSEGYFLLHTSELLPSSAFFSLFVWGGEWGRIMKAPQTPEKPVGTFPKWVIYGSVNHGKASQYNSIHSQSSL